MTPSDFTKVLFIIAAFSGSVSKASYQKYLVDAVLLENLNHNDRAFVHNKIITYLSENPSVNVYGVNFYVDLKGNIYALNKTDQWETSAPSCPL